MGYPLMFYVAEDIREQLRSVENRSELINELLRDYFKLAKEEKMTPEELDKKIAMLEIQVEANKKIEELKNA
jgi:hypothetical protein